MQQKKLEDYCPSYPRKCIKGSLLAATALVALGAAAGCRFIKPDIVGIETVADPTPIEEVQTEGMISIEDDPTPDPPMTPGAPMVVPTPDPEELMLSGDIQIIDDQP